MHIAIRTDASGDIGTGHLMRTLALADELRARGAHCVFICRECPDSLQALVRAQGHKLMLFPKQKFIRDELDDAAQTKALCVRDNIQWMIVDHYQLSATWEFAIKTHIPRVMAIDDLDNRAHACDLLLDQNLERDAADYAARVPDKCKLLLGTSYALLRPQFSKVREHSIAQRRDRVVRQLLITLGGTDPLNVTSIVLHALRHAKLPDDSGLTVVLSAHSKFRNEVEAACLHLPWPVTIAKDVNDMATLMANADIAISAAGSTLWELCCTGVPTIAIMTAENQRHSCVAVARAGVAWLVESIAQLPARLPALLEKIREPSILAHLQETAARVTDGRGCARVANIIIGASKQSFPTTLRAMCAEDLEKVRAWRNHPEVRRWMHNPSEIGAEEHAAWFERSLLDPSQRLLIAEEAGSPIGFVRFTGIDKKSAEWGFYKVPGAPAGSGTRLGQVALNYAFGSLALKSVHATVLSNNQRSLRFHRKLGFQNLPTKSAQSIDHFTLGREDWLNGDRL